MTDFSGSSGSWGQLGRVREVVDARRLYIEFQNGGIGWVDTSEASDYAAEQVVLVYGDRIEPAPSSLWHQDSFISVVRIKKPDTTILEYAGSIRGVPTNHDIPYNVGYTVEALPSGVTRVLDTVPLSLLDLPEVNDSAVEGFIVESKAGLGTFEDFGGIPEVIERARKLIETPLKYSKQLSKIGARQIRSVLFVGVPGTGKTMLARIIARESGATFYQIKGPEVVSKWVGQTEQLLRRIFDHAQRQQSAIIFFDEIDSIAEERRDESHEASRRVVAQLLTLMDACNGNPDANVFVIGTTNRVSAIDPALRRPGRFDWEIFFPLPDRDGREKVLRASSRKLKVSGDLPHGEVADRTDTWSPADLTAIWSEAAMLAVTDKRDSIIAEDYIGGMKRVRDLRQRKSNSVEEQE